MKIEYEVKEDEAVEVVERADKEMVYTRGRVGG